MIYDWSVLWRPPYGEVVAQAVLTTLELSLISWAFALVIGVASGLARGSPHVAVRLLAAGHVEIFRNVPLLVQLFFIYYVFPRFLPDALRRPMFSLGWESVSAVI